MFGFFIQVCHNQYTQIGAVSNELYSLYTESTSADPFDFPYVIIQILGNLEISPWEHE